MPSVIGKVGRAERADEHGAAVTRLLAQRRVVVARAGEKFEKL